MSGSTGKTYEISGETTEWEDILIKKGITTKADVLLGKGLNPLDFMTGAELGVPELDEEEVTPEQVKEAALESATMEELDDLLDEEDEDAKVIEEYRQKRLNELKMKKLRERFGEVYEITKADWTREVNDCSKTCWVIVHLYQDSLVECRLMEETLMILASKFKDVKFVKIRSTQAVENWPDSNLPTLFAYNDGELKFQSLTLKQFGGKSMTPNDLEWFLAKKGVVTSELEEDPRLSSSRNQVKKTVFGGRISSLGSDDEYDD